MIFSEIFQQHLIRADKLRTSTAKDRIIKIKKLTEWIKVNEERIAAAIHKDFGKSAAEVHLSEIMPTLAEARYIIRNLKSWMHKKSNPVPLLFLGTKNERTPQPKGTALIISPWNYPFVLTVKPLLSAIAAGCTVLIKPSELSTETSALLAAMISELFDEHEIKVILGGAQTAIDLQELAFNHIHFTGSPNVGKMVMKAAAKNLTSVTLELGGKSPTIVDKTAHIKSAAEAIAYGKFLNAGQTCIAPDYLYVHESKEQELIAALKSAFDRMSHSDFAQSTDYCRIINAKHYERQKELITDAQQKGAVVIYGNKTEDDSRLLSPTLLTQVSEEMKLMQEEIFGPTLPIIRYSHLNEVIDFINKNEKPLSLYLFSKSRKNQELIKKKTSSGALVINDFAIQFIYNGIPFGGIGNSGLGYSGGYEGFLEFSHLKPTIKNYFSPTSMFYPPYSPFVQKITRIVSKYFA